jgi:hypothetical protein
MAAPKRREAHMCAAKEAREPGAQIPGKEEPAAEETGERADPRRRVARDGNGNEANGRCGSFKIEGSGFERKGTMKAKFPLLMVANCVWNNTESLEESEGDVQKQGIYFVSISRPRGKTRYEK